MIRLPIRSPRFALAPTVLALSLALAACAQASPGDRAPAAGEVRAVKVGDFDSPVYVEDAPGARGLLFVVEQGGTIQALRDERRLGKPFLDITDRVLSGGEQGLLSVAFPPDYERSRRFYVYFTNRSGDGDIEVDEFKRSRRRPAKAVPGSRRVLLMIEHSDASNHNGGQLQFGPDGFLYLGTGDGGGSGDFLDNARDKSSLLGKLLRIDPTPGARGSRGRAGGARGRRGYRVPRDNPYVGKAGRDEIWSYGLRNPWRFSFDGRTLSIGDVGQNEFEEIDMLGLHAAKGANFGWPEYEGNHDFDPDRPGDERPTFPVLEYGREGGNCSVTGGYVVRDRGLPALRGRYLYADFCAGHLRSFRPDLKAGKARDDGPIGVDIPSPSSFGEGAHNQIYVASLDGPVYRLEQ